MNKVSQMTLNSSWKTKSLLAGSEECFTNVSLGDSISRLTLLYGKNNIGVRYPRQILCNLDKSLTARWHCGYLYLQLRDSAGDTTTAHALR